MLEKTMRLNYLFDFYQTLLTPKQKDYMKMYYLEDLTLVEIAQISNVSRQAVYDNIKRTEIILESYEEELHLYHKFNQRTELYNQLESMNMNNYNSSQLDEMIQKLKALD